VIRTQKELDAAIANAKGGETFQLAAGTYSASIYNKSYSSKVTFTSLDASNPATLSYTKISGSSNIIFKSLDLGRPATTSDHMVRIMGGSNITFDSVHVHGSLDGYSRNDGLGFIVDGGAKNISIVNSEMEQLSWAGYFKDVNGLTLAGNNVHDIRNSALYTFSGVTNLVQTSTSVTSQSLAKVSVSSTSLADATTSFAPASLSDTLAATDVTTTQSKTAVSSSASVFTPTQSLKQAATLTANKSRTSTSAANVTLSTSLTRQSFYQLAVGQ
jgi:hypothetical protein